VSRDKSIADFVTALMRQPSTSWETRADLDIWPVTPERDYTSFGNQHANVQLGLSPCGPIGGHFREPLRQTNHPDEVFGAAVRFFQAFPKRVWWVKKTAAVVITVWTAPDTSTGKG
jgi:hypothetical protein